MFSRTDCHCLDVSFTHRSISFRKSYTFSRSKYRDLYFRGGGGGGAESAAHALRYPSKILNHVYLIIKYLINFWAKKIFFAKIITFSSIEIQKKLLGWVRSLTSKRAIMTSRWASQTWRVRLAIFFFVRKAHMWKSDWLIFSIKLT